VWLSSHRSHQVSRRGAFAHLALAADRYGHSHARHDRDRGRFLQVRCISAAFCQKFKVVDVVRIRDG